MHPVRLLPSPAQSLALCALLWATGPAGAAQDSPAASTQAQVPVAVVVTEGGGLDADTLRTLRSLVRAELRRSGLNVQEPPALEGLQTATTLPGLAEGRRILVLRIAGRLGTKLPLILEEVNRDGAVLGSATLTAANIEECDIVLPRLVQALLGRKPVEATARMATVTESESREFRNRPGNSHFIMGLQAPLFSASGGDSGTSGLSLGYLYNTEHWMLGVEGGGCSTGDTSIGYPVLIHAAWLPSSGPISPYFGAGIGYLSVQEKGVTIDDSIGLRLSAGVEFFRLHRMRLQAGIDVYLPQAKSKDRSVWHWDPLSGHSFNTVERISAKSAYPVLHVRVAF